MLGLLRASEMGKCSMKSLLAKAIPVVNGKATQILLPQLRQVGDLLTEPNQTNQRGWERRLSASSNRLSKIKLMGTVAQVRK